MQVYEETDSQLKVYLYPSEVCWLSQNAVISCVFALSAELSKLLQYHNQQHLKHVNGSKLLFTWLIWPTFLVPLITGKLLQDLKRYFEYYFPHQWQYPAWI